jgi:hypothetical protein
VPNASRLGTTAFAAGGVVAVVAVLAVFVPLPIPDYLTYAVLGLAVAAYSAFCALTSPTPDQRRRALLGLALALTPVVLLVYFLSISDG